MSDVRTLSLDPVRPLKSREIAHIIGGLIGALAGFCEPAEIEAAMNHFYAHADIYKKQWRALHDILREQNTSAQPGEGS